MSAESAPKSARSHGPTPWGSWLALSAGPVVLLLAVTNHLTQEIAPIPFLWVLPLVVYLLSFIVTFESERWYRRALVLPLLAALSLGIAGLRSQDIELPLPVRIALYVVLLFVACVASHGELAATKPDESRLTGFYAAMATGGALGGVFVGLLAPALFTGFYELELGVVFLLGAIAGRQTSRGVIRAAWPMLTVVATLLLFGVLAARVGVLASRRDFFGVVRIALSGDGDDETNLLMHGRTVHGAPQRFHRDLPTTYYALESGVGRLLTLERAAPRRVGVIGLGIGTLAAYGRKGDVYRFYEISPAVVDYARSDAFTFLSRSKAKTEVALGDARTTLEREPPQNFDVLVLDAFSSDSVPVHLLSWDQELARQTPCLSPSELSRSPTTLNDRKLEKLELVVALAKPVLFAVTAVVLMVVWAFQGHFLIAGCMAGLLGLPVVGIIALNRETRTWARALIALAVIAGMGLAMWRFVLAWL